MSSRRQMLEFLATFTPTPPGPTPITDLTGCTWVGNNNIDVSLDTSFSINFTSNSINYIYFIIDSRGRLQYDGVSQVNAWEDGYWANDAYKTIQITGGTDTTNTDLISWLEANGTLQQPITPTKTFDLSTLGLSAGAHTVQVKARATGYRDSNFSNSVSYVVA